MAFRTGPKRAAGFSAMAPLQSNGEGELPQSTRPRFAGVVFDLDGVLAVSEHLWEEHWTIFADAHGYTWTPDDTATVQGMSVPEWAAYLGARAGQRPVPEVAEAVVGGMITALHAGRVDLLPGAPAMVATAAARVPIGVASSAARRVIDAVLEATDLRQYFSAVVSSEEVPRGKPAPDVYLAAAREIGIPATECIGVEDSSNGIRAAAAAGMTVIAIPNPHYPPKPDALALCAQIAASPDDVRETFAAWLPASAASGDRR
ncbi:MAG: HAD family phosphatase [Thermomicrobiales bacterium]